MICQKSSKYNFLYSKKSLVLFTFIYLVSYIIFYDNYLSHYFSYMGGVLRGGINFYNTCIFYLLGIIPIFFFRGFRNLASGISYMVYMLIYIPCLHATIITYQTSTNNLYLLIFTLCCSMISFFCTDGLFIGKKLVKTSQKKISFKILYFITILLIIINLILNIKHFRFVNFLVEDKEVLYGMRASAAEGRIVILNYLSHWLKQGLIPLCLVYGLASNNKRVVYSMIIGYIIMFMTDFQKITFITPFVIIGVYYIIRKRSYLFKYCLSNSLLLFCILGGWIIYLISDTKIGFSLAAVFLLRTLLSEDSLMSLYLTFFEKNPYTYFTHINIVDYLSGGAYPYSRGLGIEVTNGEFNANACFLITDGYASMGCLGIFMISIIFILFKSTYNSVAIKYNKIYIFCLLLPAIMAMLNVSLFTAILTSGFGLIYILLLIVKLPNFEK